MINLPLVIEAPEENLQIILHISDGALYFLFHICDEQTTDLLQINFLPYIR